MSDLEAKAEEIRQMAMGLEYEPEDYIALFKSLKEGNAWIAQLTDMDARILHLPDGTKYAEGDWKPTAIEALESLREKLAPFVKDEE